MTLFTKNGLARPGSMTVAGHAIDLGRIKCDTYVVGGETDHLTPWRADYHTVNLVGGPSIRRSRNRYSGPFRGSQHVAPVASRDS